MLKQSLPDAAVDSVLACCFVTTRSYPGGLARYEQVRVEKDDALALPAKPRFMTRIIRVYLQQETKARQHTARGPL